MNIPSSLSGVIQQYTQTEITPALAALVRTLREQHGASICAVLFYGSCLRSGDHYDGLIDLYALVDDYQSVYGPGLQAFFNWLLPPNVFYVESKSEGRTARAKCAVISMADFRRGTSMRWFNSYLWGRFAQPCGIAYVRDSETTATLHRTLARAVITFACRVMPRLPASFTAPQLWQEGLRLSYQTELRAEKSQRNVQLFQASPDYYEQVTSAVVEALPYPITRSVNQTPVALSATIGKRTRLASRLGWFTRRAQGKLLTVLRLLKAFFTFQGGLDYIVWKLERHSGARIEVPERVRRYPLIFVWGLFWRLYRRGIFR